MKRNRKILLGLAGIGALAYQITRVYSEAKVMHSGRQIAWRWILHNGSSKPITIVNYRMTHDDALHSWGTTNWVVPARTTLESGGGFVDPSYYHLEPGVHTLSVELLSNEGKVYKSGTISFETT